MILVTGVSGFVGSHFLYHWVQEYPDVPIIGLYHKRPPLPFLVQQSRELKNVRFIQMDLARLEDYKKLPLSFGAIFHFASVTAQTGKNCSQRALFRGNVVVTNCLVKHLSATASGIFVLSSSASVYGTNSRSSVKEESPANPATFYGKCKLKAEEKVKSLEGQGWRVVILRYSSVYGPGQYQSTVLPLFIKQARGEGIVTVWGDGSRIQDFVYVDDVVKANFLVWQKKVQGIFNIGSGRATSMLSLAQAVVKAFKPKGAVRCLKDKEDKGQNLLLDIQKARQMLSYKPDFSLLEGLKNYKEKESWWRED